MSGVIGREVSRVDGPAKVTGAARYSGEIALPDLAYAQIVGAGVASGRIASIDTAQAERAEGVVGILTHRNLPKVNTVPLAPSLMGGPAPGETFFPMQDDVVHYAGQPVAIVVAGTLEQAQHAATLVRVAYAQTPSVTTIGQGRADAYIPEKIFGGYVPGQVRRGNAEDGFAAADLRIDASFRFAANHHNPIEALTTTAHWDGDQLTLYDSCQGIKAVQLTAAALLGISPSKIRVLTRFVGGAFGCKAMIWPHVTLAALAAQHVRRPVRLALPRAQMFTSCGHREEQEQHIEVGATSDGTLTAIRHHKISLTSPFDDWAEPAFGAAAQLYACPSFEGVHHLVRGNTMTPTVTRGPGEALGVFTLECAMDELASQLGIDPIQLRLRNITDVDPNTGHPWSSSGLRECFERGARRFGWAGRHPQPRSERDGNWLIGTGMAAAAYPVAFFMRTQRARAHLYSDGTAVLQTATQEFGTGMATVMTQVAADGLGIDLANVRFEFGDTDLPTAGSPVGSNGAMMVSAAVHNAAIALRDQLIAVAVSDSASPLHGADPAKIVVADGRMTLSGDTDTGETYSNRHRTPARTPGTRTGGKSAAASQMTSPPPSRLRPGRLLSGGVPQQLPARPLLTIPAHLQHQAFADLQRQRLAAQPWLGMGGLLLGAVVFFPLALSAGSTQASLLIFGPMSTFALPVAAMIAFWWNDWPGSRLTAGVAFALNRALASYADSVHWTRATPDEWITTAALSFIGAGIILHVGIGLRWPFALKTDRSSQIP